MGLTHWSDPFMLDDEAGAFSNINTCAELEKLG
jgi:hypothetical protein